VRPTRADDRPQRAGDPSLPADHLADVALGDVEPQDEILAVVDLLDPYGVRLVHELPGEIFEKLDQLPDFFGCPRQVLRLQQP
jgi:hypothetical protein